MHIIETAFSEVKIIEPNVYKDHRGFFLESFNRKAFQLLGLPVDYVQDNHSLTKDKHTIRGLHYQLMPFAQTKLVRVISGAVYDVVVDIRLGSPTFGKWIGVTLSDKNFRMLLVPKGFAHGFCTLTPNTHVQYKVDHHYSPEHDSGIHWNDPKLNIAWPTNNPILSRKDCNQPLFVDAKLDFTYKVHV